MQKLVKKQREKAGTLSAEYRLNIFIPHCSGLLTDSVAHGDGLVAHGFIRRLAERGHRLYVAAEKVELTKPLHSNVHLFPIEARTASAAMRRVDYMLQVRSLFKHLQERVEFDLIHQLNPVYTGVSLALWGTEIPLVLGPYVADWPHDPHAMTTRFGFRSLLRKSKDIVALVQQRKADALLLTTEAARERVIRGDRWPAPIHFLPHGVDSDFFSPASSPTRRAQNAQSQVILFYANLSIRKGIFDLLRAFDIVASKFPEALLWIAGAGEALDSATETASKLPSHSRIQFLGKQNHQQALELLREADIYCLPSHGEPFGMTVAEAMSCGVPVVVTDAGGVRCLVDDKGGFRVPVQQPQLLAEALSILLEHPELRAAMGGHNRFTILETMTWDKVIDRLEAIYQTASRARKGTSIPRDIQPAAWDERLSKRGERI